MPKTTGVLRQPESYPESRLSPGVHTDVPKVQYPSPLFARFARINSARIVHGHPMLVTFDKGLFVRVRGTEKLRAVSSFPQGWVRPAESGIPTLSDDCLGLECAVIGFGFDPATRLSPEPMARWSFAGGKVWQWCQRAQAQHLAPKGRRLEALDEVVLPRLAPLDWMVVVRPDRCVLAEGPASQAEHILQRALDLIEPPHLRLDMRLVQAA